LTKKTLKTGSSQLGTVSSFFAGRHLAQNNGEFAILYNADLTAIRTFDWSMPTRDEPAQQSGSPAVRRT